MSIPLHKTRGLDPHLMTCPRCGGDTNGLTIGKTVVATLPDGRQMYYTAGQRAQALKSAGLPNYSQLEVRDVEENARVPDSVPCAKCMAEINLLKATVAAGGVYWRCKECGQEGAIKKSEFADNIREKSGIAAPDPVGAEFEKCEQHAPG